MGQYTMEINVEIKSVYGSDFVYPVCDKAKLFCAIAQTKTLTNEVRHSIKELGNRIKVITRQQEL